MQDKLDEIKLVVGLRMARAAVGWSQVELAERLGIAKTTLARLETLDGGLRADQLAQMIRLYKGMGVDMELFQEDHVSIKVDRETLLQAKARLEDDQLRRTDRKKTGTLFSKTIKSAIEQVAEISPKTTSSLERKKAQKETDK
jgi:transcriptional regulator with XRE-family HTH domain